MLVLVDYILLLFCFNTLNFKYFILISYVYESFVYKMGIC